MSVISSNIFLIDNINFLLSLKDVKTIKSLRNIDTYKMFKSKDNKVLKIDFYDKNGNLKETLSFNTEFKENYKEIFINYKNVLPASKDNYYKINLSYSNFKKLLENLKKTISKESPLVKMEIKGNNIKLSGNSSDSRTALNINFSNTEIKSDYVTGFSITTILPLLKNCYKFNSKKEVTLYLAKLNNSVHYYEAKKDLDSFKGVFMPVELD